MASTTVAPAIPARGQDGGSVGGSLTELAALEAARDEKRQLLVHAAETAVAELGGKAAFPAGCTADDLPALLQRYYWSEPAAEVLGHDPAELAGLAIGHLRLAEVRPPGSATVDVHRLPDGAGASSGWSPTTCPSSSTRSPRRSSGRASTWRTSCTRSSSSGVTSPAG